MNENEAIRTSLRVAAVVASALCLPLRDASAVLPPSVYKKRIEESAIKAVAVVHSIKVLSSKRGIQRKRVAFELEKAYFGTTVPATFTGTCSSLLPGSRPPVGGTIYMRPVKGERVFVTVSSNGGAVTSYTAMTPRLDEALRIDPKRVKPSMAFVYVDDGAKEIVATAAGLAARGKHKEALAKLEEAFAITRTYAQAYHVRGKVHQAQGQYAKAIADLTKATEMDPRWVWAKNSLAWLLATCKDARFREPKRALALAQEAAKQEKEQHQILDTLACAYAATGDFKRAVQVERDALALCRNESTKGTYRKRIELFKRKVAYVE